MNFRPKVLVFIFLCVHYGEGVTRMESAREQPCFEIRNPIVVDPEFSSSLKVMYYSMLSRWELYNAARDLLGDEFDTTPESDLYYDSCIIWKMNDDGFSAHGFNGRSKYYKVRSLTANGEKFEFWPVKGTGYRAYGYTTMTDNKTFIFTTVCSSEGVMAWALETTKPDILPKETLEKVKEHAISLGFRKEYFTEMRYDHCNLGDAISSSQQLLPADITTLSLTSVMIFTLLLVQLL